MSDTDETADKEFYGFRIPGERAFTKLLTLHQWQDQWRVCEDYYSALGLLHSLFNACEGEKPRSSGGRDYDTDRVLFLLQLADFKHAEHHIGLRTKARDVLAQNFFARTSHDEIRYLRPELKKALLTFFANENVWWNPEGRNNVTHSDKVMSKYLQEFCRINARNDPDEFRVWLADLDFSGDCCEGAFSVLMPKDLPSLLRWDLFGDAVLARLEELALKSGVTIEDAVFKGSRAAKALVLIRAGLAGKERDAHAKELAQRIKTDTEALNALT